MTLHRGNHAGSNNSFVKGTGAVKCSNSQRSVRPVDFTSLNAEIFCHSLPDGTSITTCVQRYLSRSAEWSAISKRGRFHRASWEKALLSGDDNDFGGAG